MSPVAALVSLVSTPRSPAARPRLSISCDPHRVNSLVMRSLRPSRVTVSSVSGVISPVITLIQDSLPEYWSRLVLNTNADGAPCVSTPRPATGRRRQCAQQPRHAGVQSCRSDHHGTIGCRVAARGRSPRATRPSLNDSFFRLIYPSIRRCLGRRPRSRSAVLLVSVCESFGNQSPGNPDASCAGGALPAPAGSTTRRSRRRSPIGHHHRNESCRQLFGRSARRWEVGFLVIW